MEIDGPSGDIYTLLVRAMVPREHRNADLNNDNYNIEPHKRTYDNIENDYREESTSSGVPSKRSKYEVDEEEFDTTPTIIPPPRIPNTIEMDEDGGHTPNFPPPPIQDVDNLTASVQVPHTVPQESSTTPQVTPEAIKTETAVPEQEEEDDYDDLY